MEPLALAEWLDRLGCGSMHAACMNQGFDSVDAMRASELTDADLLELCDTARDLGGGSCAQMPAFGRLDVRQRVLHVLKNTLSRWLCLERAHRERSGRRCAAAAASGLHERCRRSGERPDRR